MINGASLRTLYESEGPRNFVRQVRDLIGIGRDQHGRPAIVNRELHPSEFSIRDLAESIIGDNWASALGSSENSEVQLMEDSNAAVGPSAFNNISTFKASVGGLIEATILEQYRRPELIADRLMRNRPTRKNGEKMPGVAPLGDSALRMQPGDKHPRVQLVERYVETPELQKHGLGLDILTETISYDLTGQVLKSAEDIGNALGLRKERRILDLFLGVNNSYKYGGTNYNTYLTSGNWINDQVNPFSDWQDVDESIQLFVNMKDQENSESITIIPTDVLIMPGRTMLWDHIQRASTVERVDNQANASTYRSTGANPLQNPTLLQGKSLNPMTSILAYQRVIAADGLNIAASDAVKYWWHGDFQQAFAYMELWAMKINRANPSDYHQLDHDIVFSIFANEVGIPAVTEPRAVVRNKGA